MSPAFGDMGLTPCAFSCIRRILHRVYAVHMSTLPTADRILHQARRILDRRGADAVTMRVVAKAVGITPMALYRHFPDRDGLLNAIADQGFAEFAAVLKSSAILSEASRSGAKPKEPEATPSKSSVILSAAKRSGAKPKDLHSSTEKSLATLLDL